MSPRIDLERGGASLELVLLAPALLALLLLVVAGGRLVQARGDVDAVARDAARAASIARDPAHAAADAERVALERLGTGRAMCPQPSVVTDTSRFSAGGAVTVTVTCSVDLSDVTLLGIPGTNTIEGRATEVVDSYRGTDGA